MRMTGVILVLLIGAGVGIITGLMDPQFTRAVLLTVGLFAILLTVVTGVLRRYAPGDVDVLQPLFLRALVLRLALVVVIYYGLRLMYVDDPVYSQGFLTDDGYYWWNEQGRRLAESWKDGVPLSEPLGLRKAGYIYLIAAVYYAWGYYPLVVRFLNAFAGSVLPIIVYYLGRHIVSAHVGLQAATIVAFLPTFLFYSAIDLRDVLTSTLVVGLFYLLLLTRERISRTTWLVLPPVALALYLIRPQWIALFAATALILWLLPSSAQRRSALRRIALALTVAVVLAAFRGALAEFMSRSIAEVEGYRALYLSGGEGSSYAVFGSTSLLRSPARWPLAVLYTLLTPFPLWVGRTTSLFLQIDSLANVAWYLLVPFFAYGFVTAWKVRRARPLVWFTLSSLVLTGLYFFGSAQAGRYRLDVMPFWVLLASFGVSAEKAGRRSGSIDLVTLLVGVVYLLMAGGALLYLILL